MPDISIVEGSETDFLSAPPGPNKIALLIEVADSSLEYDLGQKATAYAEAGIQEYWVVELANRQLRILRQPEGKEYRQSILLKTTDSVSVVGMDFTVEQLLLPEGS